MTYEERREQEKQELLDKRNKVVEVVNRSERFHVIDDDPEPDEDTYYFDRHVTFSGGSMELVGTLDSYGNKDRVLFTVKIPYSDISGYLNHNTVRNVKNNVNTKDECGCSLDRSVISLAKELDGRIVNTFRPLYDAYVEALDVQDSEFLKRRELMDHLRELGFSESRYKDDTAFRKGLDARVYGDGSIQLNFSSYITTKDITQVKQIVELWDKLYELTT